MTLLVGRLIVWTCVWLGAFAAWTVHATQERILVPHEISIVADAGQPFGEVRACLRTREGRIEGIDLEVAGKKILIPAAAYADLRIPLSSTLQLRTDPGYEKEPWLYVYFELAHRTPDGQSRPKRVHIAYHRGKIESRSIETPDSDRSSTVKEDKL
jgi:hypothetical protein